MYTLESNSECVSPVDGGITMQGLYVPMDKETSKTEFKD